MANYREDIVNIELTGGNVHRAFMQKTIGGGDDRANRFGVRVYRNGEPEQLTGNCFGLFIRADGATVAIENGTISGNLAFVTLPEACYVVEGVFTLAIKVTYGGEKVTMRIVDGVVSRTSTDVAVDPGTIIPTVETLIEAINEAVESVPADYSELSAMVMKRTAHFPNMGAAAYGALTFEYNSQNGQYTITVNTDLFRCFGYTGNKSNISIGHANDVNYPIPNSFSSQTNMGNGFAFVCFDLTDTTTSTWKIVNYTTFIANENLVPICAAYRTKVFVYDENIKGLLTNSLTEDVFLNYEKNRIQGTAFWDSAINNSIAPIRGTINLIPNEYTIIFDNLILAPSSTPGAFYSTIAGHIEIDWSSESSVNFARFFYYDQEANNIVALCYGQSHPLSSEVFDYKNKKRSLALLCIVYRSTFVYTCGSAQPGTWFINGEDIYGGGNTMQPDLFKAFRKVGVIGDSLSVGYMYNKKTEEATSRMLPYSWVKQVMKDAGVPWLNMGTSGQNVLTWCSNETYGKAQAEAAGNKCQAYIIGLGENDQSNTARGIPLGTPGDIVENYQTVATTYYGGYARIIQILKHINPDCKIFCLTNPRTGSNRATYNTAVRYIAGTYYTENDNVFLVDLANNDANLFNGDAFLPMDAATITGGHYSAVGYARIASIMEKSINRAMEANQEQMINIAFIEYDTGDPTPNTMTE